MPTTSIKSPNSCELQCAAASHVGLRRNRNEDSYFAGSIRSGVTILAVADGMGGHPHGDIASSKAIEWFVAGVKTLGKLENLEDTQITGELIDIIDHVQQLFDHEIRLYPERADMGTTLTAVLVDGAKAHLVHVGDSRCFLFRDNKLAQLSTDHTLIEQIRSAGYPQHQVNNSKMMHALWNCIGVGTPPTPEIRTFELHKGDRLLLCSDGLTNMVDASELRDLVAGQVSPQHLAECLIDAANSYGGRDNITTVVCDCGD